MQVELAAAAGTCSWVARGGEATRDEGAARLCLPDGLLRVLLGASNKVVVVLVVVVVIALVIVVVVVMASIGACSIFYCIKFVVV